MNILEKAQIWTRAPFDLNTQNEIQNLLDQNDMDQLNDRFL
jgi:hypothetical protein